LLFFFPIFTHISAEENVINFITDIKAWYSFFYYYLFCQTTVWYKLEKYDTQIGLFSIIHSWSFSCEITAFIGGNCVLCCFISENHKKTDKNTSIFVISLILFVILLILFVNSLLKQQNTQLPAMKAVISHENF
jgi:hypothetical protein